ncbi:glycosyltransferase group 2 family protein [Phascolarctobacterium sp. CAG:266]|nr:glycosyltransferase group 2 family protein [Phascolarctobacterium sp. CAG:266]
MENNLKISVIIPVYNVEKYLKRCLDSVINQAYKNLEIILVDDGSTDNTLKILQEFALKNSRIKIFCQENQGAAVARNLGLSIATGKYVIFLDSDDYFEKDLVEKSVERAEKFNADIVVFRAIAFDNITGERSPLNDKIGSLKEYQQKSFNYKDLPDKILNLFLIAPWNKLYNREFLNKHSFQFQNVKRSNDLYFTSATLVSAEKIILLDKVLVNYRVGLTKNLQSGNDKTPLDFYKALVALKNYLEEKDLYCVVYKSYLKMAVEVIFYNINSLKSEKQFKELIRFFKKEGFKELKISEYERLYTLTFLGYLQYRCVVSNNLLNNIKLLRFLYKLFKIKQYFAIVGICGLLKKIKQDLITKRRRNQCK